jgi:hypothetical protein
MSGANEGGSAAASEAKAAAAVGREREENDELGGVADDEEAHVDVVNVLPRFRCPDKEHVKLDPGNLVCQECGLRLLELCEDCHLYTASSGRNRARHYRSLAHKTAAGNPADESSGEKDDDDDDEDEDDEEEVDEEEEEEGEKEEREAAGAERAGGGEVWGVLNGVEFKRGDVKCGRNEAHDMLDAKTKRCLQCGVQFMVRCCGKWFFA